jgi:hypothetical protein
VLLALALLADCASAAIITNASGRRTVKPSATVTIRTTTSGQRQIAIRIDPEIPLAFRLDVAYPEEWVQPVNFGGINTSLNGSAIEFIEPYLPVGGFGLAMVTTTDEGGGLISNIEGRYAPDRVRSELTPDGAAPLDDTPVGNRPDGGADLFTLYFVDNAPDEDKTFTVLGVEPRGVDPTYERYIADNFLDLKIDDPTDPRNGELVRISGFDIERLDIFVPGARREGDPSDPRPVPLPAAVWAGLLGGALAFRKRRSRVSRR